MSDPVLPETDTANIHLQISGREHVFPVTVQLGQRTPLELLPVVNELAQQATALAIDHARAQGKETSCTMGCGACCRQMVGISVVEAQALAELVARLPAERQSTVRGRFADALQRLEAAHLLSPAMPKEQRALLAEDKGSEDATRHALAKKYFALKIPCPFLEDESCSIYAQRPSICREYYVTTPAANCADVYHARVEMVRPRPHMGKALAFAMHRVAGTVRNTIPLVLALEWSEASGANLHRKFDGLHLFQTLLAEMDSEHAKPFDQRAAMD